MKYIIWTKNNGQLLLTIAGEDIDTTLAVANIQAPYLVRDSEDMPDTPPSTWVVDWVTGEIKVDPGWVPPEPAPAYGAAWLDLISSALYRRVLAALPTHNSVAIFTGAFLKSVDQDFTHQHWAGALSASAIALAAAVNGTAEPLTTEEMQWVDAWSNTHHLGLTINWEAA